MINLVLMNGEVFIWNADDWFTLRSTHRIIGNLIGTLGILPRQDSFLGLPLVIMPEEARLLLDQKVARLVQYEILMKMPTEDIRKKFEAFRLQSYKDQVEYFQSERKKQITNMVDIIMEGKRRKLMGLSTKKKAKKAKLSEDPQASGSQPSTSEVPDREALIKQEFSKIVPITKEMTLVQTPTACPWVGPEEVDPGTEVTLTFPSTQEETLRSRVFSDLWGRGLYVTSGHKFGGHFLVYPGDPIKFHAQFVVVCQLSHKVVRASELVALGRLANSVRKSLVLATLGTRGERAGEVVYHTVQWAP